MRLSFRENFFKLFLYGAIVLFRTFQLMSEWLFATHNCRGIFNAHENICAFIITLVTWKIQVNLPPFVKLTVQPTPNIQGEVK